MAKRVYIQSDLLGGVSTGDKVLMSKIALFYEIL